MNTLTIKGMHCDACKKLISMELEDAGLLDCVVSLEVSGDNVGKITLKDGVSAKEMANIKAVINKMNAYSIE